MPTVWPQCSHLQGGLTAKEMGNKNQTKKKNGGKVSAHMVEQGTTAAKTRKKQRPTTFTHQPKN